jgi:hypothetical protein
MYGVDVPVARSLVDQGMRFCPASLSLAKDVGAPSRLAPMQQHYTDIRFDLPLADLPTTVQRPHRAFELDILVKFMLVAVRLSEDSPSPRICAVVTCFSSILSCI